MDLDAYVLAHAHEWQRLEALVGQRRLNGAEADDLASGYQEVATHLSVVRSSGAGRRYRVAYLSSVLARARTHTTGRPPRTRPRGATSATFLGARSRPRCTCTRRWWLGHAGRQRRGDGRGHGLDGATPRPRASLDLAGRGRAAVGDDFENYYSEYAASHFAAQGRTNNAWVAALCLALGVFGVPVAWLLFYKRRLNVAVVGALMQPTTGASLFFGLILPHGLLELTAVFVAGGIGPPAVLGLGRARPVTRLQSLAHQGRSAAAVALGLALVFCSSAVSSRRS